MTTATTLPRTTAPRSSTIATAPEATRAAPPHDWQEGRRLRGFDLHEQGWSGTRIAEALGVTKGAVSQWLTRAREGGGREALRHQPPPGSKPQLNDEQRGRLTELLAQGAEAHDFIGELWTAPRIALLIARQFGVRHHPSHVGRILRSLGWTPQKPMRRALQRDEAAIATWQQEHWPQVQAKVPKKTERSSL